MINISPRGEYHTVDIDKGNGISSEPINKFYCSDVLERLSKLKELYSSKFQLIYIDPPFMTGQSFRYKQDLGEKITLDQLAYRDLWPEGREEYLSFMKQVFESVYDLLSHEGSFYLHVDYRTNAYLKVMLDEVFGEDNFLNEIVWHYQSGGRAKKHFSRKHDTILFYRKSKAHYFNIEAIGINRGDKKRNNMKKEIDKNGKVFWSIKSGGKIYKYYEDSKIYPSDVWTDISHLHQKNPERTGYDTQKPEALLERIILSSSRPGDYVGDFFAGSGTTLFVAQRLNRQWIGIDSAIHSMNVSRKRLLKGDEYRDFAIYYDENDETLLEAKISIEFSEDLDSNYCITLLDYETQKEIELLDKNNKEILLDGIDYIDYWALGYIKDSMFYPKVRNIRDVSELKSQSFIKADEFLGEDIIIHVVDLLGNQVFRKINIEK